MAPAYTMIWTANKNSAFSNTKRPATWRRRVSSASPQWTGFFSATVNTPARILTTEKYAKKIGPISLQFTSDAWVRAAWALTPTEGRSIGSRDYPDCLFPDY